MALSPDDLFALLGRLGIVTTTVRHDALHTVEQSRALRGEIAGGHTKNLFLKDKKGRFFLVSAEEDAALDLKRLHERIGASGRLSFAAADQMRTLLGVEPGSVTLFAAANDHGRLVTVVIDAALAAHDAINCHPLVNTMTTTIATADLMRFLDAVGHPPRVLALASAAEPASG